MIDGFLNWFISLGWQAASCFLLSAIITLCCLFLAADAWWQGREMRRIKRRRAAARAMLRELNRGLGRPKDDHRNSIALFRRMMARK